MQVKSPEKPCLIVVKVSVTSPLILLSPFIALSFHLQFVWEKIVRGGEGRGGDGKSLALPCLDK